MATYLNGTNSTVTIDGTPMAVEDGNWEGSVGMDEVSNLLTGGFYSSVMTLKKATGSLTCVYDGDSPPDFEEGDTIALAIAVTGGPGFSGNVNITKMSWPKIGVKAAVRYSFDWESNGPYVKTGIGA
jgi:hypothetical protein